VAAAGFPRASEASESVFENACFALELSMQKQEHLLKEDPFLGDANWSLVWRYENSYYYL
ncbi:unnamed protein product, partial [Scytosiphon promiscuus]